MTIFVLLCKKKKKKDKRSRQIELMTIDRNRSPVVWCIQYWWYNHVAAEIQLGKKKKSQESCHLSDFYGAEEQLRATNQARTGQAETEFFIFFLFLHSTEYQYYISMKSSQPSLNDLLPVFFLNVTRTVWEKFEMLKK